jgi:carbonic anhydrase
LDCTVSPPHWNLRYLQVLKVRQIVVLGHGMWRQSLSQNLLGAAPGETQLYRASWIGLLDDVRASVSDTAPKGEKPERAMERTAVQVQPAEQLSVIRQKSVPGNWRCTGHFRDLRRACCIFSTKTQAHSSTD